MAHAQAYPVLEGRDCHPAEGECDRIPSTTPGAEPPRDVRDSGSARSHSTHQKLAPQIDREWSPTWRLRRYQAICPLSARNGR